MAQLLELYSGLEFQLQKLERQFVRPYLPLPPTSDPSEYDLDVRAYCVLSHAAFEQYIEDLCLQLTIEAVDCWIATRQATNTLLGLLTFGPEVQPDSKESNAEQTFFDYVRFAADERKGTFSRFIWNNNGVSSLHLRQLLLPVGLNVPNSAKWLGSLNQLAKQRGEQAHKGYVKSVPSPDSALEWVRDCLEMCEYIRNKAMLL